MSDGTKIEWTEATWNPITGCSVTSPGCTNCYAMKLAGTRLRDHPSRAGLTADSRAGPVWTGETRFNEEWLDQPLRWKRPRMIFVCAHGDLFHESVPDDWIDRVFAVMALCPQHTFQVLTKRSARMREYLSNVWGNHDAEIARTTKAVNYVFSVAGHRGSWGRCGSTSTSITTIGRGTGAREYAMLRRTPDGGVERFYWRDGEETWTRCADAFAARVPTWGAHEGEFGWGLKEWPLPNVWLGVSVEDQQRADERIPDLLATPARRRWLSCEPLLGPVDLKGSIYARVEGDIRRRPMRTAPYICWIVAGGESGPGARPMQPDWARSLRDQCATAAVPFFFKQWGNFRPTSDVNGEYMVPATKREAGRLLDGVLHDGYPE
jgi:protein gp37